MGLTMLYEGNVWNTMPVCMGESIVLKVNGVPQTVSEFEAGGEGSSHKTTKP